MTKPRRMRWAGHVAGIGKRKAYGILVGKPEGKRPLGRPRHKLVLIVVVLTIYTEEYCLLELVVCLKFTDISPKCEKSQ
jgi:hypothetical protein